ncbi:lytic murein transglycosylase [Gordonia sp. HY285]|uniref:lytic transglycosylase domain-containing protein n=1 Tax=Gordonia liuliyuniae TaxID=2911517 RepID=UPI001F3A4823|nr:lytic murein transglycosylase [Gordonia liuliyuniae]MCF8608649.1 lytic murein transglycosylase [Gordonia liuliyuniae]
MPPNRKQTRNAVLVAAGLIPMVGSLMGASSSATDHYASPSPTNVVNVSPAAQPAVKPAAHKSTVHAQPSTPKPAPQKPIVDKAPAVPESVTSGAVPKVNFAAYHAAEESMGKTDRRCHIDWKLIAGIGRVESHHANLGDTDKHGRLRTPIYGPTLNGSLAGNRVVNDTDGGRLDGDATYDRAVGPMQFLPETWEHYAADGNGDGKSDPQNVYDAALTTAHYLCDDGLNLSKVADQTKAVLRYNNSTEYVNDVLGFARSY